MDIISEQRAFIRKKTIEQTDAAIRFAMLRHLGIDLEAARASHAGAKLALGQKLRRLIERERLRGLRRHWSYDLNRHISLKQALDDLRLTGER